MERFEDVVAPQKQIDETPPLKKWRLKFQEGSLGTFDFTEFFINESKKYYHFDYEYDADSNQPPTLKCVFNDTAAKEEIIDVLMEFILGDNPKVVLDKLQKEGNSTGVCGKVFKNGEPTYSCRTCGMDPTCVLCVNCFKQSQHRFHKYKMSTSGGGGCCDCGDEEAWKNDHYCEVHLRAKENPVKSNIITDAVEERCEIAFTAILSFCVVYLEIETNASMEGLAGDEQKFCTVLYNDESHTFDQVIQTLVKNAKCKQRDASEMTSSIDREGRAVVKFGTFQECISLKESIEKQPVTVSVALQANNRANQSLKVSVLHMNAVCCQQFAIQLLSWFQDFLIKHITFRKIFAKIVLDKKSRYSIRHLLEIDVKLWKTARTCWHRLLISGMLMEYDNKLALAQEFSRHYATVIQDFIRDDHDHSFSIVSLSVQLFTVPSIAHNLIANEGIFYKLLHTFYHESIESYITNKTLRFAKHTSNMNYFKRASHILYDLRYILSFKPDEWTDALREGFLEGCKILLKVLNVMQGMESVTRQTGQHMDYEPEWESAFNLHIKLACTISLVLEWSATDKQVLQKLYVLVMRYLTNNLFIVNAAKKEERSYADHVANCLVYDVSSKPVSIHLPLSRLFAGVFLSLGNYGLTFDNAVPGVKRTPEEIIEPILCTQVMIAQVHSGMWRRNGYSLLHQLFFYRNVRCRAEMIDRDIVGMQIGAALIESNQYLIILLNKFNLLDWAQDDYEEGLTCSTTDDDFVKQLGMIDEFLEFLIVIIGERWMPGLSDVTEEDRLKKEIIQLLCIKPYSHSELNRALPDSNNEAVLEDVIESVAIFKKPQVADAKGVYELKDELFDSYNMYFYHYTKEEKSKSEETQRLRRKNKGELECCPPPHLPKLIDSFVSIAHLLQCDVMMKLISTVLKRALDLKRKSFQESHLQKILHLIGYGLQEQSSGHYPFLLFCERSKEYQILQKLEDLSRSSRVESHRDFIIWTIKKFKEVQSQTTPEQQNDENLVEMESEDGEAPLTAAEKEKKEKDERKRRAEVRRQLIMAQMEKLQRDFMQSNKEMYNKKPGDEEIIEDLIMECDVEGAVAAYKSMSCLGYDRRIQITEDESFNCMLCSEECVLSKDGPTLVYPSYIQKSKVLSSDFPDLNFAIYISSCGHVMHADCWKEYFNNEECKEHRRLHRPRPAQKNDFQCPYCRCLSNAVLPLTAPLTKYATPNVLNAGDENVFPIDQWLEVMKSFSENLSKMRFEMDPVRWHREFPRLKEILNQAHAVAGDDSFNNIANVSKKIHLSDNWIQYTQNFIKSIHTTFQLDSAKSLEWLWRSCTYTIQSIEVFLRATNKPFSTDLSIRHTSCLSGLIRGSLLYGLNLSSSDIESLVVLVTEHLDTLFKNNKKSVLEWDCFTMMSMTLFMIPNFLLSAETDKNIITNGSIMDFYVLQTFFLANMLKAILQFDAANIYNNSMDVDDDYEDLSLLYDSYDEVKNLSSKIKENIITFYRKCNMPARVKSYKDSLKQEEMAQMDGEKTIEEMNQLPQAIIECNDKVISALFDYIKNEMKEFLRCCCLFFHFVTDVDFPESFLSLEADSFENMCEYLGLSKNLGQYFDSENTYKTILEIFASHPDIVNYNLETKKKSNGDDFIVIPCTKLIPNLYDLPQDYSDLINCVSEITCPNNEKEEMRFPTLCLRCGVILCGQSYCCQPDLNSRPVGACTYHSSVCGAEIGLFLRIRECELVYLGDSKGCYFQAPYLDDYGETDPHLKRGNPLHLSKERYNKLHLLWLGHGLHEEIARLNDNNSVPATQWHHM